MRKQDLAILVLLALFLTACVAHPQETQPPTDPTLPTVTEPATEPETVPPTEAVVLELPEDAPEGSTPLTTKELADYAALFTQDQSEDAEINWHHKIMTVHFHDPRQIDLQQLFSSGCGCEDLITDAEMEFLKTQPQIDMRKEIHKLPANAIEQILDEYMFWHLSWMNEASFDHLAYFPETDTYFCNAMDMPSGEKFEFINGYICGRSGLIKVFYTLDGGSVRTMDLFSDGQIHANVWPELDEPIIPLTQAEIDAAIQTVKDQFHYAGCVLTDVWYDKERSDWSIESYMTAGNGNENGVSRNDVIVILSNFTVAEDADDSFFTPGSAAENYKWTLIRDGKDGAWRIDDNGW